MSTIESLIPTTLNIPAMLDKKMLPPKTTSSRKKAVGVRDWHRITTQEKLKLQIAVNLGLPADVAGQVTGMKVRNANRIVRNSHLASGPLKENDFISLLTPQENAEIASNELLRKNAEFDTMVDVMNAHSLGIIRKRNLIKLEGKVNAKLRRLAMQLPQLALQTLPEALSKNADHLSRQLPLPISEMKRGAASVLQGNITDQDRWLEMPLDERQVEHERIHEYLFHDTWPEKGEKDQTAYALPTRNFEIVKD